MRFVAVTAGVEEGPREGLPGAAWPSAGSRKREWASPGAARQAARYGVGGRVNGAVAALRELRIAHATVSLADTIRTDFDVSDLLYGLTRYCVELLDVNTAGVLLADENDQMQTVASSHQHIELLELFQAQHDQGPCVDAHRSGEDVSAPHLEDAAQRWPEFVGRASAVGVQSVHAAL